VGWTFGDVVYFTALNIISGNSQPTFDACNVAGKVLTVANPLVGLTLFGIFIALLTMIFQPSEWSFRSGTESPEGGTGPHRRFDSSQNTSIESTPDALGTVLEQEIARAEEKLGESTNTNNPNDAVATVLKELRETVGQLRAAQEAYAHAERSLNERAAEARSRLAAAGPHIGIPFAVSMKTIRIERVHK
jgi:hypothetical protein